MYGKQKSESDRASVKSQKRDQLKTLLVNKFRTKYNVNSVDDQAVDKLINEEVAALLAQGSAYEANLYQLDKKLEDLINQLRGGKAMPSSSKRGKSSAVSGSTYPKYSIAESSKAASNYDDVQSVRSHKSMTSRLSNVKSQKLRVYHVDPAANLNPTDEEWNDMVQKNLKNFEEEKQRVIRERIEKSKKIQEEQKRQMQLKAEMERKIIHDEISQFNTTGIAASAPFYVNEDKRKEKEKQLKGSGQKAAQSLANQYANIQEANRMRMKKEAEERQLMAQKLAQEDALNIKKRQEEKLRLREVQERDKHQKLQQRNMEILPSKSQDFAQKNLLSYVYEKKDHKAYEYRKRNDHLQSLMKDQFMNTQFQSREDERNILRDEAENNRKIDTDIQKRTFDRKQKELEAKLFLDKQIAEKNYVKQMQLAQKQADFENLQKQSVEFTQEQQRKKDEKKLKNLLHVEHVKQQMHEQPRTFAKTGIAIIKQ